MCVVTYKYYILSDFLIPNIILSNPVNIFGLLTTTTFMTDLLSNKSQS